MTHPQWPGRLARAVAAEVRRHRDAQGLSAQQLADRCADLGMPIGRSVLANFESGRRPSISLPELLVLAKALGVPPITLLFPIGREETAEPLPDHPVPTWLALGWFTGENPLPKPGGDGVSPADGGEWQEDRAGVISYRWHKEYVARWHRDREAAARATTDAARKVLMEQAAQIETPLHAERKRLREKGLQLPELPAELQHIDADDFQPDWGWMHR